MRAGPVQDRQTRELLESMWEEGQSEGPLEAFPRKADFFG